MTNRLLPIYREFDVNMGTIVQAARAQGYAIPCKEGCDACCYDVAYTTEVELALVVERIRRMSPHRQKKIADAVALWERRLRAAGVDPDTVPVEHVAPKIRQAYYGARAACPLLDLERHRCMVYEDRPLACRGHWLINQEPSVCANVATDPTTQNISNVEHLAIAMVAIYETREPEWGLLPRVLQRLLSKGVE